MEEWGLDFENQMKSLDSQIREMVQELSRMIKEADAIGTPPEARQRVTEFIKQIENKRRELDSLMEDALDRLGISEGEIASLESNEPRGDGRLLRADINTTSVKPTGHVEDLLPQALDFLLQKIDPVWLRENAAKGFRLSDEFLNEPFSMVSGIRVRQTREIHRYAQALLVAKDFIENHPDYDFYEGALLVPQLAQLGTISTIINEIRGDVRERLRSLHDGLSIQVDSTIYELLVAGACVRTGRKVEMLIPTIKRTPDIRIHDLGVPCVVETKRRRLLFEYELSEEAMVRELFFHLCHEIRRYGIFGVVEVEFKKPLGEIPTGDFVRETRRVANFGIPNVYTEYDWGNILFRPLPARIVFEPDRLYSPSFLQRVFGWVHEPPKFDGVICKVEGARSLVLNEAASPIALFWRSISPAAALKKSRAVSSLFGDALKQVPSGEMGIVYLCYQEGARPEIADGRTQRVMAEMAGWYHRWGINVPAFFINRLFPRPADDEKPDLIENVLWGLANHADPVFLQYFPSCVFTRAPAHS